MYILISDLDFSTIIVPRRLYEVVNNIIESDKFRSFHAQISDIMFQLLLSSRNQQKIADTQIIQYIF